MASVDLYTFFHTHADAWRALLTPGKEDVVDLFLVTDLNSFLNLMAAMVTQMLHKFREGMTSGSIGKLIPKDGNVHPMSSNVRTVGEEYWDNFL